MKKILIVSIFPLLLMSCATMDGAVHAVGFGEKSDVQRNCDHKSGDRYQRCLSGGLRDYAMRGVAEEFDRHGERSAARFCDEQFVERYGKYVVYPATDLISYYTVDECHADAAAKIASLSWKKKLADEKEKRYRDALAARKSRETERAEEDKREAEAEKIYAASVLKARTLVSPSDVQLISNRVAKLHRLGWYQSIISEENTCWKSARSRSAVAKCGSMVAAETHVAMLALVYKGKPMLSWFSPSIATPRIKKKTMEILGLSDSAAQDFIDTYVAPHLMDVQSGAAM